MSKPPFLRSAETLLRPRARSECGDVREVRRREQEPRGDLRRHYWLHQGGMTVLDLDGWVPVTRPGYDEVNSTNGTVVKTAGYAGGFSTPQAIGNVKFRVKKAGQGSVTFGDTAYILDRDHQNSLVGVPLPKPVAFNAFASPVDRLAYLASLFTFGSGNNLLALFLLLAFLALLAGIYWLVRRGDEGYEPVSYKDEIFGARY